MPKCILNTRPDPALPAHIPQVHWGYLCEVDAEGRLIADIPESLIQNEVASGRAVPCE